jgi:hypothetical protein
VTNSPEFVIHDGTGMFSLDDQLMATMIAKKCKGDFDTHFFVIDNFIKHANAKGYNRHVVTGAMQPSELLSVRIEFKKKMKQEAGMAQSRKRKNNPIS